MRPGRRTPQTADSYKRPARQELDQGSCLVWEGVWLLQTHPVLLTGQDCLLLALFSPEFKAQPLLFCCAI